jgi:hypothetical protein
MPVLTVQHVLTREMRKLARTIDDHLAFAIDIRFDLPECFAARPLH